MFHNFRRRPCWPALCAVAFASLLVTAHGARASLIGDQVTIRYFAPNLATQLSSDVVTAAAGPEIDCSSSSASICGIAFSGNTIWDVQANAVRVDFFGGSAFGSATFNGVEFSSLDFVGSTEEIIGVNLTTDMALSPSAVTFGPHFVRINFVGATASGFAQVNLVTNGVPVPEPASFALLGLGLAGLGGLRRRPGDIATTTSTAQTA